MAVVGAVFMSGLELGCCTLINPGIGVTKANFDRIEFGLSEQDTEKILGPKWGFLGSKDSLSPEFVTYHYKDTCGRTAHITYQDGCVCDKYWEDETTWTRVKQWFFVPVR